MKVRKPKYGLVSLPKLTLQVFAYDYMHKSLYIRVVSPLL